MPPEIDMAAIKALPRDERIALAEAIWETVEEEAESGELTEAQKAELDRRIAYADAHPEDGVPWEIVLAEAEARRLAREGKTAVCELTDAQIAELERRLVRYQENPANVISWEVVKVQARQTRDEATPVQHRVEECDLSPEDEAILDEVWAIRADEQSRMVAPKDKPIP